MALTTAQPPRHFRPQSESQRLEVLRRIDAAEFEALKADSSMTPDPHRLRTDADKPVLRVVTDARRFTEAEICQHFSVPLREPSVCGFGVCELKPECTSSCRYRAAEQAMRGVLPQQAERLDAPEPEDHFPRPVPLSSIALIAFGLFGAWSVFFMLVGWITHVLPRL